MYHLLKESSKFLPFYLLNVCISSTFKLTVCSVLGLNFCNFNIIHKCSVIIIKFFFRCAIPGDFTATKTGLIFLHFLSPFYRIFGQENGIHKASSFGLSILFYSQKFLTILKIPYLFVSSRISTELKSSLAK